MNLSIFKFYFFTTFLILFSLPSYAFKFENIIFQYAGEIGKYSLGTEKHFTDYYSLSFHYGIVPENEIQDKIETYTLKNTFRLFRYNHKELDYRFYSGLGLFHVPGSKYETQNLDEAPNNYYRQSSIRGLLYIGHEVTLKKTSIYLESGINDIWLINSVNNDSVDWQDHVSLGIGLKYKF